MRYSCWSRATGESRSRSTIFTARSASARLSYTWYTAPNDPLPIFRCTVYLRVS